MNQAEKNLLQDVKHLKNKKKFVQIGSQIGNDFFEIVKDTNGKEVTEVGRAMLGYYLDLFQKDIELGMNATRVIISGYDGYPKTDLFAPYYDSFRTRKAWLDAIQKLSVKDHTVQVLIFNTYFRWYVATHELFRKMLIFDCYCISQANPNAQVNLENYLFGTSDPVKMLTNSGTPSRKKLVEYYDATIRHAVAHGNLVTIPDNMIVIRSSNFEKSQIDENIYRNLNPDNFIKEVAGNIEILFQSIRLFYTLFLGHLLSRNAEIFEKYVGSYFSNEVLAAMIADIRNNFGSTK